MALVLHVITTLDCGGAEMMLFNLLSASNGQHRHAVVSLKDNGPTGERIAKLGVPVYSLGMRAKAPNPLPALSLRSLVRQLRPQLIQGWMYHGNLMASLAACSAGRHTPVLWGIHHSLYSFSKERRLTAAVIRLDALLSRRVAGIIYVSQTSRTQHEAFGYAPSNGLVIPNGLDCRMFVPNEDARRQVRAELNVPEHAILIGLVARYHPMKDHAGFLRGAALVAKSHPSTRFVLVGRGIKEQPMLMTLMADLGISDRIALLGERYDIPRLVAGFDIACSASAWGEAFSIAVGEAMACGVPCVVTDVGDSAYLVGETGLCVPPQNPEGLAQAISQLISAGPERRRQLGISARSRIEREFSLPEIVNRYQAVYRKHLGLSLPAGA